MVGVTNTWVVFFGGHFQHLVHIHRDSFYHLVVHDEGGTFDKDSLPVEVDRHTPGEKALLGQFVGSSPFIGEGTAAPCFGSFGTERHTARASDPSF